MKKLYDLQGSDGKKLACFLPAASGKLREIEVRNDGELVSTPVSLLSYADPAVASLGVDPPEWCRVEKNALVDCARNNSGALRGVPFD